MITINKNKLTTYETIITEFVQKSYSELIKNIKNLSDKNNKTKDKRKKRIELITLLIKSIIEAGYKVSHNLISGFISISSKTYYRIIDAIKHEKPYEPYKNKNSKNSKQGNLKSEVKNSELLDYIEKFLNNRIYADPSLQEEKLYAAFTLKDIQTYLKSLNLSFKIPSLSTIARILKEHFKLKFSPAKKDKVFAKNENTDEIFDNIRKKTEEVFQNENIEAISLDDKTSFKLGTFSNGGKSWLDLHALDHDYSSEMALIFGFVDLKTYDLSVFCNSSKSTANFKIECISTYIEKKLQTNPKFDTLYLFLDNGPENSWRRTQWKYLVLKIALHYGITIEMIYYPPYHSKYNLIERYWGSLQKNFGREIIETVDKLILVIEKTVWNKKNAEVTYVRKKYKLGFKKNPKTLKRIENKFCKYENENIKQWSVVVNPGKITFG